MEMEFFGKQQDIAYINFLEKQKRLGREFSGGLFGKKSLGSYQEDKNEKQLDMWEVFGEY